MTGNEAIREACKEFGLDGHLKEIVNKRDASTYPEQFAMSFKKRAIPLYIKNSYMYCDSLDVSFWVSGSEAFMAMSGRWWSGARDLDGNLQTAIDTSIKVVKRIQELLNETEA